MNTHDKTLKLVTNLDRAGIEGMAESPRCSSSWS